MPLPSVLEGGGNTDKVTQLKDLLDLKQQQANVLEARQSRKQAVIAAKQGKVVLVFTVVTIVFVSPQKDPEIG